MKRNGYRNSYPNYLPASQLRWITPSRTTRRGRRPRRPFLWMTDNVGLLLNATIHIVGRTVPGAPFAG